MVTGRHWDTLPAIRPCLLADGRFKKPKTKTQQLKKLESSQ
jgi:hypothetical protein